MFSMTKISLSDILDFLKKGTSETEYNDALKIQVWLYLGLVFKYLILTIIRDGINRVFSTLQVHNVRSFFQTICPFKVLTSSEIDCQHSS